MLCSLTHPINEAFPISVTLFGISMLVKPVQSKNDESLILTTLLGIVMLVKLAELMNALF